MIKFWSYKQEYKYFRSKILKSIDKTLNSGKLFFGQELNKFEMNVDLVLLAMGFVGPERDGLLSDLGVTLTNRGNVWRDENWMTSTQGIFTAGDMQRGQSLIVWAIAEGRSAARGIDHYLMGSSNLPALV